MVFLLYHFSTFFESSHGLEIFRQQAASQFHLSTFSSFSGFYLVAPMLLVFDLSSIASFGRKEMQNQSSKFIRNDANYTFGVIE